MSSTVNVIIICLEGRSETYCIWGAVSVSKSF